MPKTIEFSAKLQQKRNFAPILIIYEYKKPTLHLSSVGGLHCILKECLIVRLHSFLHTKGSSTWNVNVGLPAWYMGMSIFISFACLQRLMKSDLLFKKTLSELPSAASLK